jgi:ABC-type transporter lipoprotein component MlaA
VTAWSYSSAKGNCPYCRAKSTDNKLLCDNKDDPWSNFNFNNQEENDEIIEQPIEQPIEQQIEQQIEPVVEQFINNELILRIRHIIKEVICMLIINYTIEYFFTPLHI